nr:hypothetical protein [Actinomycetota bacterium]
MIVLGFALFALAALVTGGVVFSDSSNIDVTAFGWTLPSLPLGVFFVLGLLTGLIGLLGLGMLANGAARGRESRRQAKLTRRRAEELRRTNERLTAELA